MRKLDLSPHQEFDVPSGKKYLPELIKDLLLVSVAILGAVLLVEVEFAPVGVDEVSRPLLSSTQ